MAEKMITSQNFLNEVTLAEKPVIVDFWAPWCQPCRRLSYVISELEERLGDTAVIGKVNIDEQPELARIHGVTTIPTMIRFDQGVATGRMTGFYSLERLCEGLRLELPEKPAKGA